MMKDSFMKELKTELKGLLKNIINNAKILFLTSGKLALESKIETPLKAASFTTNRRKSKKSKITDKGISQCLGPEV